MGYYDEYLEHHGILGQKWGVRRFENAAGRLTAAGKSRYNQINGEYQKLKKKVMPSKVESTGEEKKKGLTDKQKKMIIAGAAVAGTALAAYGGYKLYQKSVQTRAHAHMLATGTSAVNKAIAKESNTKLSALKDYSDAMSGKATLVNPEAYKSHWNAVADRNIGELNKDYDKFRKNAAEIAGDYKKSQAYLKSVKNRTNKKEDFTDISNRVKAISNMGKPKASTPPPVPKQDSSKALSDAKSALKEFQALQSNPNKPTFSKPAQNGADSRKQEQDKIRTIEQNLLKARQESIRRSQSVSNVVKINGSEKFSQAAKADDDYVSQMLKKNASNLSQFTMKDLRDLDLY